MKIWKFIVIIAILIFTATALYAKEVRMLYFYVNNCRWCKKMEEVLKDKEIKRILSHTKIKKINVTGEKLVYDKKTEKEVTRLYKVKGVPTVVFVDSAGKEIFRVPGLLTKDDFKDILCNYVKVENINCKR